MGNVSTKFNTHVISNKDIIKNLQNTINFLEDITHYESEENSLAMEFEEHFGQSNNINIFENYYNLNNLIKIKLMQGIYPKNENKKPYYFLELKDGETNFIERNKEYKCIIISKETYQKGEIFELDKNNKILLIILFKTLNEEEDKISLYCLDLMKKSGKNSKSEFHYKIPSIKDYSFYILEKNEKKDIIMLSCCQKEIHSIKLEITKNNYYNLDLCVKTKDKYIVEDELTSICSIKNIKKTENIIEKNIAYYTKYFLVSSKTHFKLFKYDEDGNIIYICDIDFEKESNDILNRQIHINNISQLDNGIIIIDLNNQIFNSCLILKEKKAKEKR